MELHEDIVFLRAMYQTEHAELAMDYPIHRRLMRNPAARIINARRSSPRPERVAGHISVIEPEWSRERLAGVWDFDPGRRLLRAVRARDRWASRSRLIRYWWTFSFRVWSSIAGAEIPLGAKIGGGLRIPHPSGIVIHPDAVIGSNCLIFQQVTIGTRGPDDRAPVIGADVEIGAGAKILGGVRIGDHAKIGAGAVVIRDVPQGATAVGVPARIVNRRIRSRF